MGLTVSAASAFACFLAACSAPMTYPERPTMQTRADWLKDWDHLSSEAASDFLDRYPGNKSAVFVEPAQPNLSFASAYQKLLEEKLLDRGVAVSETAIGAHTILMFDVQTFLYDCEQPSLTGGVVPWIDSAQFSSDCHRRSLPALWTPVGAVIDALASTYDGTRAEVLLTLSVHDGGYLRYQHNTEFYTRPADLAAFYKAALGSEADGHFADGNRALGVWEAWPESWDNLPGPEKMRINQACASPIDPALAKLAKDQGYLTCP